MMREIFKTVLMLSAEGAVLTLLLMILKPYTSKKFSARWQKYIWLAVIVCMLVPAWKFIPERNVQKYAPQIVTTRRNTNRTDANIVDTNINNGGENDVKPAENPVTKPKIRINIFDLLSYLWVVGVIVFFILGIANYCVFLARHRKNSINLEENRTFDEVKDELNIKRKIRVRISRADTSPMLVGTVFPVIYLPSVPLDKESEKMVFRHELTHLKKHDLPYKYLSFAVNALHWFNPFAYVLSTNIAEACETACDTAVVKNMDGDMKNLYMKTILDLAQKKKS